MKTPLSIHVLYHSKYAEGQKVYEKLYQILCRNTRNPFADGLDIPVFFGTDVDGHVVMVDDSISEKTIVLLLIDSNMRIDKIWQDFVKTTIIAHPRTYNLYCVDLYKYAFEFLPEIKYSQFIGYQSESLLLHWSEFEARVYDISIRLLEKEGKNQQKVFISHSKHDSDGKSHAEDLRDYLVHNATKLSYFFDVNSIMEGYAFNKQIEEGVKESIFITMVSNTYSDREWCRKELIEAKKNKIPVIGVYLLNGKVERMFPYIGNMPGVAYTGDWQPVVNLLLRTALNQSYQEKLLKKYTADHDEMDMLTTMPEAFSFSFIDENKSKIIYPEPPLCNEELNILKKIRPGVELITPMESKTYDFHRRLIGISISESDDQLRIGVGKEMVNDVTAQLLRYLLKSNAQIVYGGNLGPYTEMFSELSYQYGKYDDGVNGEQNKKYFTDYIAWPYTKELSVDKLCEFDHCRVDVVLCKEPDDVDTSTFSPVKNTTENLYLRGLGLTKMRTSMERAMDDGGSPIAARIFIGGRSKNFTGQMAGLLEEFKIALSEHHPIFLIGGFGGITKMLADKIEHGRLTSADFLQKAREDAGYDAVRAYYNDQGQAIDYSFIDDLNYASLHNGLTDEQNRKLFNTVNVFEILPALLDGINDIINPAPVA